MRYAHAPIVEGLIDFRVVVPDSTSIADVDRVEQQLSDVYTRGGKLYGGTATLEVNPEVDLAKSSADFRHRGYRLHTPDEEGRIVLQVSLDGFTCSKLAPYRSWEELVQAAKQGWDAYREELRPTKITRVAVRYINRIDIPASTTDPFDEVRYEDYVLFHPDVPSGYRYTAVAGFVVQTHIPQPDLECMVTINSTIGTPVKPNTIAVVLDFDLFRVGEWAESDAWAFLEKLRVRKNELFEQSITDATRRLIS